jgi:crotonobetainyl-CoA:carnitine CoA-transferase CaiB-like acyl-CoA transferase
MSVLAGLRVVQVPGFGAAAWAAKNLADWGAEVLLLEPASGSPLREAPPYYYRQGERRSGSWAWLARGCRVLKVAPEGPVAPSRAVDLCLGADLVLVDQEMALPVLGLRPAELRERLEGRTTCVLISPFALDGPYRDYQASDLITHALGGWMGMLGDAGREPLRPGGEIMARVAGAAAWTAALIALRHHRLGGPRQWVEVSCQAVAAFVLTSPWLVKSINGFAPSRRLPRWPQALVPCADGYVACSPLTATHWEMLCRLLGLDDVLELPGGREPRYWQEHGEELYQRVKDWYLQRTRQEIVQQCQLWRLPAAGAQNVAERLQCPQLQARGFFVEAEVDGARVRVPRPPLLIRDIAPVHRPPPIEDGDLPPAAAERQAVPEVRGGADGRLPFAGIRVVDLTWFWSGPSATMLLGALGADVIKLESVQRPDSYRFTLADPSRPRWWEWGPLWNDTNCDKRGITLDLTHPRGRQLFEALLARADVVISNFSNRVMPNLGYGPDQLLAINPRLIVVTMPGYGPGGPWEDYVGYGVSFEQLAVCASVTGYPDGPPMIMGGFSDPLVGLHTVAAIEMALRWRERTGRGTAVEVPQCEVLDSIWAPEHIAVQHGAPVPGRRGNKHDWMAPHGAYRVAGDDRWVAIAVASDQEFASLARVLGRPELASDPRFATVEARKAHEEELDRLIAELVAGWDGVELERALQAAGVRAGRVVLPAELEEEPGLRAFGFFQRLTRPVTGTHWFRTWPFRFSGIDRDHKRPPPLLGQHNAEVLQGLLGVSDEGLEQLQREHVIGDQPLAL